MLVVGFIIGGLTGRLRQQTIAMRFRENRTEALYHLNRDLAKTSNPDEIFQIAAKPVQDFFKCAAVIFAPDKNLGSYVNMITGRNMVLWEGSCEVHDIIKTEAIINLKTDYPGAKLIAHPECKAVILQMADFIGSTTALLNFTKMDPAKEFIVATETGILHQMQKSSPDKKFYVVPTNETCSCNDCPYMKLNTLPKLLNCLEKESPEILLTDELMDSARKPILRMLELSK